MAAHELLQPVLSRPHAADSSLALAVIAASHEPLLLLDGEFTVVAASASFCEAFAIDPATTPGRPLFDLGRGEWETPELRALLRVSLRGEVRVDDYEMDLIRRGYPPRRLAINAGRLDHRGAVRVLLGISDLTAVRARERLQAELLAEKTVMLKEVEHRIANSLQIVASLLLHSARKVPSEETRVYLREAHGRVMSVAAVQRQLTASGLGDVSLRAYFTELCDSIAASMIGDPLCFSLTVDADDSLASAEEAIRLGLVITELVINALKHAFTGRAVGAILVSYAARGAHWTLSVKDDGVGLPAGFVGHNPGLGRSIVEALAKRLEARIHIADAKPGMAVTLSHD
jgi:two-component sensor histidine kinase